MFVLFVLYTGAFNPFSVFQGTVRDRYADPNAYPWQEEDLFINPRLDGYDMGGRRPPFRSQPKIKTAIFYTVDLYDNQEPRGQMKLIVNPEGSVSATWTGEFRAGDRHYQAVIIPPREGRGVMNGFTGNTAPLKIYEDETGQDISKLYAITHGFYHLKDVADGNEVAGPAYITAWISKDHSAEGTFSIPSFVEGRLTILRWGPVEPSER
jgi:hypothetical protein